MNPYIELIPDIDRWVEAGKTIGVATVIRTWGSSPRQPGAKMVFSSSGDISGSVSGGCVEGAVVQSGLQILETGRPESLHFGVTDETAWDVGLACGGQLDVFVNVLDVELMAKLRIEIEAERTVIVGTVIEGSDHVLGKHILLFEDGNISGQIGAGLQEPAERLLIACQNELKSGIVQLASEGEEPNTGEMFVELVLPPKQLVIVGGVHIAQTLVDLANTLGYRTVVIEPREAFANRERFANVSEILQEWPQDVLDRVEINHATAVAILTHDQKIDDPALEIVLPSKAFYVGALGSRKTQSERRERLLAAGVEEKYLDRLHGPIGLDIGARSPHEIALAIMAEIVAAQPS